MIGGFKVVSSSCKFVQVCIKFVQDDYGVTGWGGWPFLFQKTEGLQMDEKMTAAWNPRQCGTGTAL